MKLKRENELKKNSENESSKKDDEKESEEKKKSVKRKKRIKRKERVKKMKGKKKKKQVSFYAKTSDVKSAFIQTSLYLYSCTKGHFLILTNLTNLCLVLLSLCCRNMRTCFPTICLIDCHLLEK